MTKTKETPTWGALSTGNSITTWEQLTAEKATSEQRRQKARTFSALGYPDSLVADWREQLEDMHIAVAISPLHDQDVFKDTGELKKPHYHVIVIFEGQKSLGQIEDLLAPTGLIRVQVVPSLTGAIRYLIHLDNRCDATDGRHRYPRDSIETLGPLDVAPYLAAKHSERSSVLLEMRNFIRKHDVLQFSEFIDYVDEKRPDWRYLLSERGTQAIIETYIRTRWREVKGAEFLAAKNELVRLRTDVDMLIRERDERKSYRGDN